MGHTFLSFRFVKTVLKQIFILHYERLWLLWLQEKFACSLQNACSVIIGKTQGNCLCQSPVSETFSYGLLKTELYRWHFSRNVLTFFFWEAIHKAPLNDWLGKVFTLFSKPISNFPWAEQHNVMCQSVIRELLQLLWE